jgi:hypothetical protein
MAQPLPIRCPPKAQPWSCEPRSRASLRSECLPAALVSAAEVQAVLDYTTLVRESGALDDVLVLEEAASRGGAKAATGKSYKALRKLIDEQCKDRYLVHCTMTKVRLSG